MKWCILRLFLCVLIGLEVSLGVLFIVVSFGGVCSVMVNGVLKLGWLNDGNVVCVLIDWNWF